MIELTIYGLAGNAALLFVASYFAYRNEFRLKRDGPSLDPSGCGDCSDCGRGRATVYADCGNAEGSHD